MKYGKMANDNLLTKVVENGKVVGGGLTEGQIVAQGYKFLYEIGKTDEGSVC